LVGPRPEQPKFVERFCSRYPAYNVRHRVRAGLTGWAQVNGLRGDTSIRQRMVHDLYYIENWSLALDLRILWRTLWLAFHEAKA
ncbi:MAG TPA: sugar transferase, partial [Chondromyces sp.]|nr:sugar transferase [Chondromyces sp.]